LHPIHRPRNLIEATCAGLARVITGRGVGLSGLADVLL
jgi:hypothetical protein